MRALITMKPIRRRLSTWIACFAVLFASLAPTVSHALATDSSHAFWAEICSVDGLRLIKTTDGVTPEAPAPANGGMHFEHCPFCLTHADSLALLPTPAMTVPVADNGRQHPSLFYHAPRPLFAWTAAQPRAPPSAS